MDCEWDEALRAAYGEEEGEEQEDDVEEGGRGDGQGSAGSAGRNPLKRKRGKKAGAKRRR